jgi:CDP-diacylglycerol--glycerol-3-phosphate 3-phosphatidyltransferase
MFDGNFRSQIEAGLKPVGNNIKKLGITADMITAAGVVMAVGAAVAIGAGALSLGLLLLVLTGIPDLIDGAVAKAWGTDSLRGAFFDSVSDRLTDGLLFGGVTWYLASTGEPTWVVILPVAAYVSASLVSYIRASLLIPVLALIVVLNVITAGQRFVKVWRQATDQTPALSDRRRRRSRRTPRAATRSAQRTEAGTRQRTVRRPRS